MSNIIDTDTISVHYREASVDLNAKRLLITNFSGTEQEKDLTEPPNCNGFGRIRHFRRGIMDRWPQNPLPIDPACKALSIPSTNMLRAQVFQNAACNWRCWYCFVPFNLLAAKHEFAEWLTPSTLVDLYLNQPNPPPIIDLTGGQPDLVPEWVPWMMTELRTRGLEERIFIWSDDNLSNDYFWRFLSDNDRELITSYRNYSRVGCFKGFNSESFSFNTGADPQLFNRQFELMSRFLTLGIDLYAYATFTTPSQKNIRDDIHRFIDNLQTLNVNLPLRTVPLEIQVFTPNKRRLNNSNREALKNQKIAVDVWQAELERRFNSTERSWNIADVPINSNVQ